MSEKKAHALPDFDKRISRTKCARRTLCAETANASTFVETLIRFREPGKAIIGKDLDDVTATKDS